MECSGLIPFCTVLPDQAVEESLHRGDCTLPFWPRSRWKLVFCFVSSHALGSNSYVESRKKNPKPHQVRKTGSLKPLEDDNVLCAAPGVAFVQEVVGGFDFLQPHDDGKIMVGTWKLRAVFFTVWDRELWNSVNISITRGRAMFLLGCSATVFLSCRSSNRTAAGGRRIKRINLNFYCRVFITEQEWEAKIIEAHCYQVEN